LAFFLKEILSMIFSTLRSKTENKLNAHCIYKFLPLLLAAFAIIVYIPSLFTPYWGDDYVFLQQARFSRLNAESWWLSFHSSSQLGFWRPLSMDSYFRFLETYLDSNVFYAHATNFFLWILASASVGFFAWAFAGAMKWKSQNWLGLMATGVYGINGAHFLPVHWVAAVNSSILVCWTSLAFGVWVLAPQSSFRIRICLCILLPVIQLLALLSKESSILIPFLLLALSGFGWRHFKISRWEIGAWMMCVMTCAVWFYFYRKFSGEHPDGYGLKIGVNILRNFLSLSAWLLNIPREALRLMLTGREFAGLAWALAVAIPMSGFIYLSVAALRLRIFQWLALLLFIGFAYAPYFLLAGQSYEYYAAVALIFPVVVVTYGLSVCEKKLLAVMLLVISSMLSIQISRMLDYPSLLGRAEWGEEQLQRLERSSVSAPVLVQINNPHRFYAIGVAGLSWRLGIPVSEVYVADNCMANVREMLVEDAVTGNLLWRRCNPSQQ
jgi:hypothetical protein